MIDFHSWLGFDSCKSVALNLCNYINSFFLLTRVLCCLAWCLFLFGPTSPEVDKSWVGIHWGTLPNTSPGTMWEKPSADSIGRQRFFRTVFWRRNFTKIWATQKLQRKKHKKDTGYKFIFLTEKLSSKCTWLWRNLDINPLDIIQFIWAWSNSEQSIMTLWH